ncbi:hypothetical protein SO802_017626 [Lithocarpus litseifolius]|uniref:Uncharacterized protein n=1 Tax=Lithocarpus litseifolius TaxID=425828 RepID=A0AAW2CJW2_9ROSI
MAQLVKPSPDKPKEHRSTLQAKTVSTGEKKKKSEGREYESHQPIPCTPKELDVLLDKWIADGGPPAICKRPNIVREKKVTRKVERRLRLKKTRK